MKMPSLHNLYVFSVAANHSSFRAAAYALHVTPGAVSRQVRALEEELGVQLFLRVNQRVYLTEVGKELNQRLNQAFDIIKSSASFAKAYDDKHPAVINITVLPSFYKYFLANRLSEFYQHYPHVLLNIVPSIALFDLADKSMDFGIRNGNGKWNGVVSELLHEEQLAPVISKELFRDDRQELFDKLSLLNPYDDWDHWFNVTGISRNNGNNAGTYPDKSSLVEAVRRSKGIGLLPEVLFKDLVANEELVRISGPSVSRKRSYYLVWPERGLSKTAELFRNWLLGLFKNV